MNCISQLFSDNEHITLFSTCDFSKEMDSEEHYRTFILLKCIFRFINCIIYVIKIFACMYVRIPCKCKNTYIGQKRALNPLELKLWVAVNHHMGTGNQACVLSKSNKCSSFLSHLSSPTFILFPWSKKLKSSQQRGNTHYNTTSCFVPLLFK